MGMRQDYMQYKTFVCVCMITTTIHTFPNHQFENEDDNSPDWSGGQVINVIANKNYTA